MKSSRTRVLRFVALLSVTVGAECPPKTESSPSAATYWTMQGVREAIQKHETSTARIPRSLDEVCPPGGVCPASPPGAALADGWGRPFRYEAAGTRDYLLASAGEDGIQGSPDDIIFASRTEREIVARLIGCYAIDLSWWREFPGRQFELDSTSLSTGVYTLRPTPTQYNDALWSIRGDSIYLGWAKGDQQSVIAFAHGSSATVRGTARILGHRPRGVTATRTTCAIAG